MEYKALRVAGRSARYNALAYKQDWSGANRRRAKILGVNRRLANDESSIPQKNNPNAARTCANTYKLLSICAGTKDKARHRTTPHDAVVR